MLFKVTFNNISVILWWSILKFKKEFNPMKIVLKTYFSGTIEYQTSKNAITTGQLL
jgi:hypothetical protein